MADRRGPRGVNQRTFEVDAGPPALPVALPSPPVVEAPEPRTPARRPDPVGPSGDRLWSRRYQWLAARDAAERAAREAAAPPP